MKEKEWSEDTAQFLQMFPGGLNGRHIFVSMDDKNIETPWHLHNGYNDSVEILNKNQERGWGAFWTVNELDRDLDEGRHRTAKMWVRSRAVFMDDDNRREEGDYRTGEWGKCEPNIVVESSPGKFHYYWILNEEESWSVSKEEWMRVQLKLVMDYGGDKSARDVARYLRLPGSRHMKGWQKDAENLEDQWVVRWKVVNERVASWEELCDEENGIGMVSKEMVVGSKGGVSGEIGDGGTVRLKGAGKSLDARLLEIASGVGLHDNLRDVAWMLKRDGLSNVAVSGMLRGHMMMIPSELKDDRWRARYEDIDRLVESVEEDRVGVSVLDGLEGLGITSEEELRDGGEGALPWPPGMLGGLAGEVHDTAIYQYKELSVVTATGLIAGIAGRRFNINGLGLNVYLTLIMRTGMGKDHIGHFIKRNLMLLNEFGHASSFIGKSRFTGPKAVIDSLKNARSQVSVFTEAGLLLKSKAGDQIGLGRMLLSLYSCSGENRYSGSEGYSKADDSLPILRAPALTVINEATPETLHEAFKETNALERGDLPRQSIFRVGRMKPYPNMNAREDIDGNHAVRLAELLKTCQETQAHEDPKAYKMRFADDIANEVLEFSFEMVDLENNNAGKNTIKSLMVSRAFVKAMKFAAIATVYNKKRGDARALIIDREEWEWGKAMVMYEINSLEHFFMGSGEGESVVDDAVRRFVAPRIIKILEGKYKTKAVQSSRKDMKLGVFHASAIRQLLKQVKEVTRIGETKTRGQMSGTDFLLNYMVKMEYIRVVSERPMRYQVTNTFRSIFDRPEM